MSSHRAAAPRRPDHFVAVLLIGAVAVIGLAGLAGFLVPNSSDAAATAAYGEPIAATAAAKPAPAKHQVHHAPVVRKTAAAVAEDDPRFDCRTGGNRTCGPDNAQHVTPGCYWAGKLLVAWQPAMAKHWVNCGDPTVGDWHMEYRVTGGKYGIPA
jgi:hypothetical protein